MRLKVSPTPSNTPSNTPSYTPTGTACPTTPTNTPTNTSTPTQTPSMTPFVLSDGFVLGYWAFSSGNTLGYSFNGTSISGSSPNANSYITFRNPAGVNSVATNGSVYVACGSNGQVGPSNPISLGLYSTNSVSWSLSNLTSVRTMNGAAMEDVIWDGNRFMGIGGGDPVLVTSTDGITWTGHSNSITNLSFTVSTPLKREAFIYYDGTSYFVGSTTLKKSTNGINYTGTTTIPGTYNRLFSMLSKDSFWLLGGYSGSTGLMYHSLDGTNFSAVTIPSCSDVWTFSTNGTIILAGTGGTNKMLYSYDGLNWSANTGANAYFSNDVNRIKWNGTRFVAVGGDLSALQAYSFDGLNWSAMTTEIYNFGIFGLASIPDPNNYPPIGNPTPTPTNTQTSTQGLTPTQTPTQTQTGTPASTQGLSPTPTTTQTPTPSVTSTLVDLSLNVEQRTGDPDFTEIWVTVENGETFSQNLSFDWSVDVSPAGSSSGTATITTGQNEVYLTGFDPNVEVFVNASLSNVTPNPIDGYNILV